MIYIQTAFSRRDPISIGLQSAFQPAFDLSDAMANALRRLEARERRARSSVASRPVAPKVAVVSC